MFWNQYPYINLNDLNLDFLLNAIGEMQNEVKNFVTLNAVKYADPIQWDITSQYEKNTIVIDPLTGTAYISVQPVPSGVALNRTDYWTPVFDLSRFITQGNENLTEHVEGASVVYSTFALNAGDWVIWNGVLYKALVNMPIGTTYSVDGNIERVTVEEYIKDILTAIANEAQARQDADNALSDRIVDEAQARQDADNALSDRIDNITSFANLATYAVSGSNNEYLGAINATEDVLTLANTHDYKVNEGLLIERAGDLPTLTPVTNFAGQYVGTAGTTTHTYSIAKIDNRFGCTPAVTITINNCASAFDGDNYVRLTFDQDSDAYAYILYRDGVLVDILSHKIMGGLLDQQLTQIGVPFNVPNTPPTTYIAGYLKAHVTAINGNALTIDELAKTSATNGRVIHDDTDEIQKAINENELLYMPSGHYNVSITSGFYCLTIPSNREIYGDGNSTVIFSNFSIAHGAIFFNDCNVYGGTNNDITLRRFAIDSNAMNTNKVCGISFRLPSIYMAANQPTNKPHRIVVREMKIRGVSGGVTFASIVDGIISHNTVSDCVADGVGCYDACEHCVIEYNNVYNTGDDSIASSNALDRQNTDIKIIGNTAAQCGAHGIRAEGTNNTIAYNSIEYTAMDGILIHKYNDSLTQVMSVIGNKLTRVGTYAGGIGAFAGGTYYDIAVRDENGATPYGFLSQIAIASNCLNDTNAIGIIGVNPTSPITNIQIAGNPTIAGGVYDISGTITPNNIHSFSQKYEGSFDIAAGGGTPATHVISFPAMPLKPSILLNRTNGTGGNFNYWISNITNNSATINIVAEDPATYTFNYVVNC